jgi:hypothetical protein
MRTAVGARKRRSSGGARTKEAGKGKKARVSGGGLEGGGRDSSASGEDSEMEDEGADSVAARSRRRRSTDLGAPAAGGGTGKRVTWVSSESADALSAVAAENRELRVQLKDGGGAWVRGSITKVVKEGKAPKAGEVRRAEYMIQLDSGEQVRQWLPSEQVQVGRDVSELEQTYASKGLRLRESGRWEAHVRIKGKKKYIGMYDSAKSAADAHDKVMAKLQASGASCLKAAYKHGTRVCPVGKEGDSAAIGTVASYDWVAEVYKVCFGQGKLVTTALPSPEYSVIDDPPTPSAGDAKKDGKDAAQDGSGAAGPVYRGVRATQEPGKFAAEIKRDGRQIRLGVWESIEAAARAYDMAAHEYQGDRAKLNFPERVKEYARELEEELLLRAADASGDAARGDEAGDTAGGAGGVGDKGGGEAQAGKSKGGKSKGAAKFAYPIGQRVRVLYDDGVRYPGKIIAQRRQVRAGGSTAPKEEYDILLDDGDTELTSTLPDPDIEILGGGFGVRGGADAGAAEEVVEEKESYVGVRRRDGYWVAELKRAGQTMKLGSFDNARDAARAYDNAALKYQGEKAKLNFEASRRSSEVANYLHSKVRVLYDDGVWYEGFISGYDYKSKEYMIRLDDDTCFTTALPDPDIQILATSVLPPKGAVAGGAASAAAAAGVAGAAAAAAAAGAAAAGAAGAKKPVSPHDLCVGARLRVLYDDGVYYPGLCVRASRQARVLARRSGPCWHVYVALRPLLCADRVIIAHKDLEHTQTCLQTPQAR